MIRRHDPEFDLLISQQAHAALAARLAEHFGNDRFARPEPRESVLTAVRLHDDGWRAVDDEPLLDVARRPLAVFDAPVETALPAWSASADQAAVIDPYAGLLVSLHVLALCLASVAREPSHERPVDVHHRTEQFRLNKFLHREVERQEQLRNRLGFRTDRPLTHGLAEPHTDADEDRLTFNLRLLQIVDAVSLLLCGEPEESIRGLRSQPAPSAELTSLRFDRDTSGTLRMKPWPFDVRRLDLHVQARALPRRPFANLEDLRAAYLAAEVRSVAVSIATG